MSLFRVKFSVWDEYRAREGLGIIWAATARDALVSARVEFFKGHYGKKARYQSTGIRPALYDEAFAALRAVGASVPSGGISHGIESLGPREFAAAHGYVAWLGP